MEKQTIFSTEHNSTDRVDYQPFTKLSAHSEQYLKIAQEAKGTMTPVLQHACELTDLMALRAAELPETH